MLSSQRFKTHIIYLKGLIRASIPTPEANPFALTLSLKYSSITSERHSFTVSYLINNCAFSPETALKASKLVRFETAEKPDSVIAFFRNNGFSHSQINSIIRRAPKVLTCNPHKRVFPKFEFLISNGLTKSDIVQLVTGCPRFLSSSLENCIVPSYELVRRFLQSDKEIIGCILAGRNFLSYKLVERNVRLLLEDGVSDSNITYLLRRRPTILLTGDMRRALDEVKEMGFDPSKVSFGMALHAKKGISKSRWDAKVDAFKSWGWSEELVLSAFRQAPMVMLTSKDKINEVMKFWVNQLGWNSLALAQRPAIFGYSLGKRIVPRGLVVKHLIAKGLRRKNASLFNPFTIPDNLFLENFVKCFEEESHQLLELYQEKMSGGWSLSLERDCRCFPVIPAKGSWFEFSLKRSGSEIVDLAITYRGVLAPRLKNHIVPTYELAKTPRPIPISLISSLPSKSRPLPFHSASLLYISHEFHSIFTQYNCFSRKSLHFTALMSCLLFKSLLLRPEGIIRIPFPTPKWTPFLSTFSWKSSSITSEQHSFTVSYLINNRGFSPETALKASKLVQFETAEKPDSVIAFFRNNGFSNYQINNIVRSAPNVLTCDPHKRVLPKIEFLHSKVTSIPDVVELVNRSPRIFYASLEKSTIPTYECVRRYLKSDKETVYSILACRHFFGTDRVVQNVRLLRDVGATDSNISQLLRRRLSVILSSNMRGVVDEVTEMGFDPSKSNFMIALLAKKVIPKSRWNAKVNALKSWGWSEELILHVFKRAPLIMLSSEGKINKVMGFWVNQLGWNSLAIAKKPEIFGFSLEKRIIPRAFVVQYLLAKGLRKESASLLTPFAVSETVFLEKYVKSFEEDTCQLLKLYQGKMSS
ncbi:uncharacterized protein LOC113852272 [Abrus precatorius]|uniref:Uncharacterized protein LOC113852272 n=1 Tax=Abrus precatorius TaxID=3816 RepID=A0A8B8K3K3_ABRPR|nr:uncharacterized protein LOC113852272 [Abrus precatorius]